MNSNPVAYAEFEDKRVVLLQSGGLDSNVCAAIFKFWEFEIHHVFVDYGQNMAARERESFHKIVKHYGGTPHECKIELPWLKESTNLAGGEVNDFDSDGTFNTIESGVYVPMRNAVLISIASSLADSLGIKYICSALDGVEDVDGNPMGGTTDKHPMFAKKLESALSEGSSYKWVYGKEFELLTPVMAFTKEDTIKLGLEYEADFSISWSCYNSKKKPCCKCSACKARALGFKRAGIKDPLLEKFGIDFEVEDV